MAILIWMSNLFSLFSSFGAIVVVVYIAVRSRRIVYWKFLAVIALLVASYGSGILQFMLRSGLALPEPDISFVLPARVTVAQIFGSLFYALLFWLIPSTTNEILGIRNRRAYLVLLPFFIAGMVLPDSLIFLARSFLVANLKWFVVLRLLLHTALLEYPMIAVIRNRDRLPAPLRKGLTALAAIMAVLALPAMMAEELLALLAGWHIYNFTDAASFLCLTTGTLVVGIYYLTASSRKKIEPVPLLDVARSYGLTERETEVMKELVSGARYKEIGTTLNISTETVKTHVSRIYRKLEVSAKQELKYKIRDFLS